MDQLCNILIMKRSSKGIALLLICSMLPVITLIVSCKKTENPIKFPQGIFPDTTLNITDINSVYDDFNTSCYVLNGDIILVFSSNRGSSGGQFDLVQGEITFTFDQTDGEFGFGSEITNDAFLSKLLKTANTSGNDYGPFRIFSSEDGYEYMLLSSENSSGNLDFYYLKNRPVFGTTLPDILGPFPVSLLNTSYDDSYICLDTNQDTLYFSSDAGGNFDIYFKKRPSETALSEWFGTSYSVSATVDSINSSNDDKCPVVSRKYMVFASNRPGGLGGYDLYYSICKSGKWGKAHNFGPDINTSANEYRPVLVTHEDFSNYLMIFSSDRSGGKGEYDLYLRGVSFTGLE